MLHGLQRANMQYFFPVHRPDIFPGETGNRYSLTVAGYKLHFKMNPISIAMNHCAHIALFKSITFNIPYQYHGLKFPYHVFSPISDYPIGYAVTNLGLFRPVSIIHTVRIRTIFPFGVCIEPSTTYFVPKGECSISSTFPLRAIFRNSRSNCAILDSSKPSSRNNLAFDFPTACVSERR